MANFNWNSYSTKNLDEQRQDAEKAKTSANYNLSRRIIAAGIAILVIAIGNIPDDFFDSMDVLLPVIVMILLWALPFVLGLLLLLFVLRKRRQEAENADSQTIYSQYEKPQSSGERYTAYTSSIRDFPNAVDSWDIKDPKPPWEL